MKKILLLITCFAICLGASEAFAQKRPKGAAPYSDASAAHSWAKKLKNFDKKTVSTNVDNPTVTGMLETTATIGVGEIESLSNDKKTGGNIYVIMPAKKFATFIADYAPVTQGKGGKFGAKIDYKKITGVFTMHKEEPVLLLDGIKIEDLKDFPKASEAIEKQIALQDEMSGDNKSSKKGYTKKFFYASKIAKKEKGFTDSELNKLLQFHNRGKKGVERLTLKTMKELLKEGGESYIVFDDAKKIEWEIRW